MTERNFRFLQGAYLFIALSLDSSTMIQAIIIMYVYEGLTNLRIPMIVSKLRYGKDFVYDPFSNSKFRIKCDAERAQRVMAAIFLYVTYFMFPEPAWFGPWFLASIFLMAGVTSMCPSVMFLRWVGFR